MVNEESFIHVHICHRMYIMYIVCTHLSDFMGNRETTRCQKICWWKIRSIMSLISIDRQETVKSGNIASEILSPKRINRHPPRRGSAAIYIKTHSRRYSRRLKLSVRHFYRRPVSLSLKWLILGYSHREERRRSGARRAARNVSWTATPREGVLPPLRPSLPHRHFSPLRSVDAASKRYMRRRVATRWDATPARPAKTQPSCLKRDEARHGDGLAAHRCTCASSRCPGTPTLLISTAGYWECPRAYNAKRSVFFAVVF